MRSLGSPPATSLPDGVGSVATAWSSPTPRRAMAVSRAVGRICGTDVQSVLPEVWDGLDIPPASLDGLEIRPTCCLRLRWRLDAKPKAPGRLPQKPRKGHPKQMAGSERKILHPILPDFVPYIGGLDSLPLASCFV